MSKADFTFYELGPELPEFVVPKPGSDHYKGHFLPSLDLIPGETATMVGEAFPEGTVSLGVVSGQLDPQHKFHERQGQLVLNAGRVDYLALRSTTIEVTYPGEIPIDERTIYDAFAGLYKAITAGMTSPTTSRDEPQEPQAPGTPGATSAHHYPFLVNDKNIPTNPRSTFMIGLEQRAYVWQLGPDRKSKESGSTLPPVYNPSPRSVLSMCSLRIELINPLQ